MSVQLSSFHERIEWPLVGGFMVLLTVLFKFYGFISRGVLKKNNLDYHDQWEWCLRCISTTHSVVVSLAAIGWIHFVYHHVDMRDPQLLGTMPYAGYVSDFSIAYFLWDLGASVVMDRMVAQEWHNQPHQSGKRAPRSNLGTVELIHHLVALSGQIFSIGDAGLPLMYTTLLGTECTTPFLNALWLQDQAKTPKVFFYLTAIIFLLLWIVFRLGFCGFGVWYMIKNLDVAHLTVPPNSFWYCIVSIPFLTLLNWFWFYKILCKFICPRDSKDEHHEAGGSDKPAGKQQ